MPTRLTIESPLSPARITYLPAQLEFSPLSQILTTNMSSCNQLKLPISLISPPVYETKTREPSLYPSVNDENVPPGLNVGKQQRRKNLAFEMSLKLAENSEPNFFNSVQPKQKPVDMGETRTYRRRGNTDALGAKRKYKCSYEGSKQKKAFVVVFLEVICNPRFFLFG